MRDAQRDLLVQALTQGPDAPFASEASVPSMPWKYTPSEGHVAGRVTLRNGTPLDQIKVTLQPLTTGGPAVSRLADGDGWFGFVHLDPGFYLVQIDLPNGTVGRPVAVARVTAGGVAKIDFTQLIRL